MAARTLRRWLRRFRLSAPFRLRTPFRGRRILAGAAAAAVLLVCLLGWFNHRLRPVLESLAVAQVSGAVTAAVNDAIAAGIARWELSYNDIIQVETDRDGHVAALKSDMARANLLRSQLLSAALEQVAGLTARDFSVPVGSLTDIDLLAGKGPRLKVRLLSAGDADAAFRNEFTAAGVNQTLHQVMLDITVTVTILLPGERLEAVVTAPVCVAQTVIVGQVPDTYLQLERGA